MARQDIPIGFPISPEPEGLQASYPVVTPGGILYYIFIHGTNFDLYWTKSTNGGITWSAPTLIKGTVTMDAISVWYDRWTVSSSGNLIHIAYMDLNSDDIFYRSLDTTTDTLGTETTIFAGATASGSGTLSIVKAIGGNLYCLFDIDGGTETGFYRSTDSGGTWAARTDANEATSDYYLLVPGFAADNQDIMCIYWDRSADEISRKIYDDSANSWAETSIAASMVDATSSTDSPYFAVTTDLTNSRIILVAWSARDLANADLRFWTITESAITESSTNVVLNSTDDQGMCAVGLDTNSSTYYVFYCGKSDGSETMNSAVNVYYKTTADLGTTWGAEVRLNNTTETILHLKCVPRFSGLSQMLVTFMRRDTGGAETVIMNVQSTDTPLGNPTLHSSGQNKTTSTSVTATAGIDAQAGQLLVAIVASDNEDTTDGQTSLHTALTIGGHGATKVGEYTNTVGGAANDGATVSIWYLIAPADIAAGASTAQTLNTGKDAKAIVVHVFDLGTLYSLTVDGLSTLSNDAADPGSLTATGSLNAIHLWVRGIAAETDSTTSLIPTSGWTALTGTQTSGGAAASNIAVRGEIKVASGTSSGASDPTYAAADCASLLIGLALGTSGVPTIVVPGGFSGGMQRS